MITLKELETMIPDKITGIDMHNKNTVVYISNGKIKIMNKESKHGIR